MYTIWRLQAKVDAGGGGHALDNGLQRQSMALRQRAAILVFGSGGDDAPAQQLQLDTNLAQ